MPKASVPAVSGGLPSRRATLATLAGLGASLTLPQGALSTPASAASAEPIAALYAKAQALRAYVNREGVKRPDLNDGQLDALLDRVADMERQAAATPPTTVAEAIVALEWAASEVAEDRQWGDRGDTFIGDMLSSLSIFLNTLAIGASA